VRSEGDRLAEGGNRLVCPTPGQQGGTKAAERFGIIGPELDGLAVGRDGLISLPRVGRRGQRQGAGGQGKHCGKVESCSVWPSHKTPPGWGYFAGRSFLSRASTSAQSLVKAARSVSGSFASASLSRREARSASPCQCVSVRCTTASACGWPP